MKMPIALIVVWRGYTAGEVLAAFWRNLMPIVFSPRLFGIIVGLCLVAGVSGFAAAADPLQLLCQPRTEGENYWPNAVKFRIDLDKKIIELLQPNGHVMASTTDKLMNAGTPTVRITASAISWNLSNNIGIIFDGLIDRETTEVKASWHMPRGTYSGAPLAWFSFAGPCQVSRGAVF